MDATIHVLRHSHNEGWLLTHMCHSNVSAEVSEQAAGDTAQ